MPSYWGSVAERRKIVNKKLSDIKQGKIEPRQKEIEFRLINKNDDPALFKRLEQRQKIEDIIKRLDSNRNE